MIEEFAMSKKTAVLLINLGTPDSPSVPHVRSYLSQFLNDPRVIDIPWLARKLLVNVIIVPFRAPKSAAVYRQLWTPEGSPLLLLSQKAADLLQQQLPENYRVYLAMRYKNPSIPDVLAAIAKEQYDRIIVLPMFPQYASATTGSAHDEVNGGSFQRFNSSASIITIRRTLMRLWQEAVNTSWTNTITFCFPIMGCRNARSIKFMSTARVPTTTAFARSMRRTNIAIALHAMPQRDRSRTASAFRRNAIPFASSRASTTNG